LRAWRPGCRWWSSPGRCATGPSTSSAPTTPPGSGRPSTTSRAWGTGGSRTWTAAAPGAAERRRGYTAALHRHDLGGHALVVPGGPTEDDGAHAARALLGLPATRRPTAVTVFNDRCATGVLDVLRSAGVAVPGEVSVVGFDDSRLARLSHVDLTTIAQDATTLAELAVARAVGRVDGTAAGEREQVVAPRLVVRGTTAAPAR
jgi:DNA-binding LacI/PurR family transcriptional regulator